MMNGENYNILFILIQNKMAPVSSFDYFTGQKCHSKSLYKFLTFHYGKEEILEKPSKPSIFEF